MCTFFDQLKSKCAPETPAVCCSCRRLAATDSKLKSQSADPSVFHKVSGSCVQLRVSFFICFFFFLQSLFPKILFFIYSYNRTKHSDTRTLCPSPLFACCRALRWRQNAVLLRLMWHEETRTLRPQLQQLIDVNMGLAPWKEVFPRFYPASRSREELYITAQSARTHTARAYTQIRYTVTCAHTPCKGDKG